MGNIAIRQEKSKLELISVIVPVYNVRRYLRDCVKSLLAQTYDNMEIILVDDGSTDGSDSLCDDEALIDSRVNVIHQKNKGLSCARNAGTACAHGSWIVYVDSDDVVTPHFIEHLYAAANLKHSDIAICKGSVFNENKNFCGEELNRVMILESDMATTELLSERNASTAAWGKLAKASIWKRFPFPEGRKFEDLPVTWKVLQTSNSVAFLEGNYYGYRKRKTSISSLPSLSSIVDYATSIQQIWKELEPKSHKQLNAKCFRCCLECCRLLEMVSIFSDNAVLSKRLEQALSQYQQDCVYLLRRYSANAICDRTAPLPQRFRIIMTALFPNKLINLIKSMKSNL